MMTLPIIPLPQSLRLTGGTYRFRCQIQISCGSTALAEAHYLAEFLNRLVGYAVNVDVTEKTAMSDISLILDDRCGCLGEEGYRVQVSETGTVISASRNAGLFYGIQTLLQLLPSSIYGPFEDAVGEFVIPCVEIEDSPRFVWRGAMVDVARHFMPKSFLFKFIDLLAIHKMNVLHLHLTDDQGWRVEIKKYPKLTEVGAIRERTLVGQAKVDPSDPQFDLSQQKFDRVPHGGSYTQEDVREVVAYASARHIVIVPEIEMPGHAQAAVAAYPDLGCSSERVDVSGLWGIHDTLFKPSQHTFNFLRDVLTEIMELFPSKYIHIGGDEAVKTQWQRSAECQAIRRDLDLKTEDEMQVYFVSQIKEFLTKNGRILTGWDEILEGNLSPGALAMCWRDEHLEAALSQQNHDLVLASQKFTYFDYYQSEDCHHEPLAFAGVVTLPTAYQYDPISDTVPVQMRQRVLGTQCHLWSEYLTTVDQFEYMAFPRLCALAEVAWSNPAQKDYSDFLARLDMHLLRLDALGVRYRPITGREEAL